MEKERTRREKAALVRCVCALLVALLLLALSGFAVVRLIKGSELKGDVSQLTEGEYVTTNLDMILDYCAEEYGTSGRVTALYAVIPYDGRLSVVILPERYYESAAVIYNETCAFLNGERAALDRYILVTGTSVALDETSAGMFYDWFGQNRDWLAQAGLVSGETEDYADVLSNVALRVDTVGRVPTVAAWILTGLAWALLIWAAGILLRWSLGRYSPKPEEAPEEAPEEEAVSEESDGEEEPGSEAEAGSEEESEGEEDAEEEKEPDDENEPQPEEETDDA